MHSTRIIFFIALIFTIFCFVAADRENYGRRRKGHRHLRKYRDSKKSTTKSLKTSTTKTKNPKTSTTKKSTKKTTTTTKKTTTKKTTTKKTTTTTKKTTTTTKKTTTTTKKATTTAIVKQAVKSSGSGSYSGDGTYYAPGLGSCGITNSENDYIVALNHIQMANGANPNHNPMCGKKIKAYGPKGSVTVTVVDTCPGCASGDLDFAPAAFDKIADFAQGRVKITWDYI